eukprot:m.128367 g.128367  ORF g.128367 m.128367 type:complete len:103 (+) comp19893_c0_seq2:8-316(+)
MCPTGLPRKPTSPLTFPRLHPVLFFLFLAALLEEGSQTMEVVHVFNLEVKDNHESAKVAALQLVDLADAIVKSKDFENEVDSIISTFEAEFSETLLHSVCFY